MANRIVGVTFERTMRIVPPHPHIEDVMKKKIRQDGTYDALNAKDNFCFDRLIKDWRSRSVLDLRRKE